ncbi:SURF1 family protein [Sediminivirga luteola]|uniref:SURF1 family cytochrome oxidase biogenesis protein n=1 Tax=Sediminivirga luteola TaxID=1774748 RepID=UPI001F578F9F|nr:SURF1 family protein [Sediminivirga luteola]MCI2264071.1 SURF1 family protein [Sediminivirga luteola]
MSRTGRYRFLLSARWLRYYALMLVGVIACVALSFWQGERREQRLEEIRHIQENYDGPVRDVSQVLPSRQDRLAEEDEWTRVELYGQYDDRSLLARNRPLNQQAGFEVVVPFLLQDGTTMLISRGWVPTDSSGGAPESVPAPPAGEATVTVRLRPAQDGSGDDNPPETLLAIDPAVVDGLEQPYLGAYGVMESEQPPAAEPLQAMPRPSVSEGSHLSYQMQWLAFGVMVIAGGVYAARREAQGAREARLQREAAQAQEYVVVDKDQLKSGRLARPLPSQERRRKDRRDEAEEDALLESRR